MILYRCGLISQDFHIDQLGYEKRLLVDQNGSLYTGYCTTFIPRSVNRLTDRVEKLRLFCELICRRLIVAAADLIPFAIGGASSATAGFIVYPINLIKTKMQTMRPKDFEELRSPTTRYVSLDF